MCHNLVCCLFSRSRGLLFCLFVSKKVRKIEEKRRKQRGYDGGELGPAGGVAFDGPVGSGGGAGNGGGGGGGGGDDVVSLDAFVEFSLWWAPLMRTLSLLRNDWASMDPVRVHGFIGRLAAERELQQKERGTFLLRFSESKQGTLVVSFTEHVSCFVVEANTPRRTGRPFLVIKWGVLGVLQELGEGCIGALDEKY